MSDDLVRQLRDWCRVMHGTGWVHLAESMGAVADHIEELQAQRDELLRLIDSPDQSCGESGMYHYEWQRIDEAITKVKETQE